MAGRMNTPRAMSITTRVTEGDLRRFMKFVKVDAAGCWIWQGTKDAEGYGQFWWQGRMHWAYRFSLAAFRQDIPRGHHAHHAEECRNKSCVAPFHLSSEPEKSHGRKHAMEQQANRKHLEA